MRKKLPLFIGALFVVFSATACEGPEGPTGPAGTDGTDGTDGVAGPVGPVGPAGADALNTCSDCHSSDATIVAIEQQFDLSPHGFPQYEVRGPDYAGGSCVACHTHQGFVAAATGTEADWTPGAASMNCRTCHQVHSDVDGDGDFEIGDYALTTTDPVTMRLTGAVVDFSGDDTPGSNLCASCHQARDRAPYPSWDAPLATTFDITSTHYGIHYGPQSNIFAAELPTEIEFGETTTGMFGSHVNVSCLGCHMGRGVADLTAVPTPGGDLFHNYTPSTAVCATCHDASFDYGGIRTDVATDLTMLASCLEAENVITAHYNTSDGAYQGMNPDADHDGWLTEIHPVVGTYPEAYVAAYLALQATFEDGSWGVHQPRYAPDIAANARAFMETNSVLCPVVVP